MRVYEAIGETLKKLEVQATFGLMGDGNLRFMTHLAHELACLTTLLATKAERWRWPTAMLA